MSSSDLKPRKSGGHGNHWDAVVESEAEIESLVMGAIRSEPLAESLVYEGGKISVFRSSGRNLATCTLAVNGEIWTAYPFIVESPIHGVTLDEVEEWANGLEAQLKCSLGPACVSFFDTHYYKNKRTYQKGESYPFTLSGLAYRLFKSEPRTIKRQDGTAFSTKGMAGFFPFQQGDIDDYTFITVVKEVGELEFNGQRFYRVRAPLFRDEVGADIDIDIYASQKATQGYSPKTGDFISGIFWLQGCLKEI